MPKLFTLSDAKSLEQYYDIQRVLKKYDDVTMIAYQSNWYIVIACLDWFTASEVRARLLNIKQWEIDISPGRKNKIRHYLRIRLER